MGYLPQSKWLGASVVAMSHLKKAVEEAHTKSSINMDVTDEACLGCKLLLVCVVECGKVVDRLHSSKLALFDCCILSQAISIVGLTTCEGLTFSKI